MLINLATKIVQNCFFSQQEIHNFQWPALKIYNEMVKFNILNLKKFTKKLYMIKINLYVILYLYLLLLFFFFKS